MEPLLDKLLRHTPPIKTHFFLFAAWYSLIAPFAAVGIAFLPSAYLRPGFDAQLSLMQIAACILISSALASVVSLFGIRRHGARVIIWKALIGFLASCFFLYLLLVISALGTHHQ
jgi:hypothetical protein